MSEVTKCDDCREEKLLYPFKNIVDTGFTAYCWDCAVKHGHFSGTSKKQMIDEIIQDYESEMRIMLWEKLELIDMYTTE